MKTPLVSVIVPTHNRAYCLESTLESALAQTCEDLEILVIDDGSTDGTGDLVTRRFAYDPRVRYVRQENGGVSAARNHGHRLARGEYLAYLDSDDRWVPWKLELQLACFRRFPETGMVFTDIDAADAEGRIVRKAAVRSRFDSYGRLDAGRPFAATVPLAEIAPRLAGAVGDAVLRAGDAFSQMIVGNLVVTSTAVIRRSVVERAGSFDEAMFRSGDYDYFVRVAREAPVGFADVASAVYRMGKPDQLTNPRSGLQLATNYLTTIDAALDRDRARIRLSDEEIGDLLARAHAWIAEESVAAGERRNALRHLARTLAGRRPGWQEARLLALAVLPAAMGEGLRRVVHRARLRGDPDLVSSRRSRPTPP